MLGSSIIWAPCRIARADASSRQPLRFAQPPTALSGTMPAASSPIGRAGRVRVAHELRVEVGFRGASLVTSRVDDFLTNRAELVAQHFDVLLWPVLKQLADGIAGAF